MYCPNCGTRCEDSHHFCYACGTELPKLPLPEIAPVEDIPKDSVPMEAAQVPADEISPEELPTDNPQPTEPSATEDVPGEPAPETAPVAETAPHAPTPRKGRIWPAVAILTAMMVLGLAVFFLSGDSGTPATASATPWFTMDNGVVYFHEDRYTGSPELTVPATIDGQTVIAIGDSCFSNCDTLTTVILPDTVQVIGSYAFAGCDSLRGVYVPPAVTSIGTMAFTDCGSLEAIFLHGSLLEIGYGCFDSCAGLKYIFFDGTYSQWTALYDGYFGTKVVLYTQDGTYYAQP